MAFVLSARFTFCRPSAARLLASTRLATSFLSRGLHAPVTPRPARLMFRMSAEEDEEHAAPAPDSSAAPAPVETESAAAPTDWSFEGVPDDSDPSEQQQQQTSRFPDRRGSARRSPRVHRLPLSQLMVGSLIKGRVRSVLPYGAFVDVGTTTDGLLHVSQLSTEYVRDTNEVLKSGDEISVRVISVDPERNEFSLTLLTEEQEKQKQELSAAARQRRQEARGSGEQPAPERAGRAAAARFDTAWRNVTSHSGEGGGAPPPRRREDRAEAVRQWAEATPAAQDPTQFITGRVRGVEEYGAFVDINAPTDGMIHISEISEEHVDRVSDHLKVGDEVQVRVISVEAERSRISLSMRPHSDAPSPRRRAPRERGGRRSAGSGGVTGEVDDTRLKTTFELAFEAARDKLSKAGLV